MTEFSLPESVTTVGSYLLCNCDRLKSIDLPDNFNEIPEGMFYGNADLTGFVHVCDRIGSKAFGLCTSLERIDTGGNTEFGPDAFFLCFSLQTAP